MMKQHHHLLLSMGVLLLLGTSVAQGKEEKEKSKSAEDIFTIYADRGSRLNHYIPSGWMGDFGDLKLNQGWDKCDGKPASKEAKTKSKEAATPATAVNTCIQVTYSAERKQGAGWAGVYWQHPANNWGDKRGGFDLSPYKKLTFMAKGEVGGETVDKVFIGGITGQTEEGDSDEASLSPVVLTKDWQKFTIDLEGVDLSHIIGGFGFAANADANPNGFKMFIDDVQLEK